jgi:fibronectin type 3 domain-containing protein
VRFISKDRRLGTCRSLLLLLLGALYLVIATAAGAEPDAATNVIVTNHSPRVHLTGSFSRDAAQRSRSATVLHGLGAGSHRASFTVDTGQRGFYRVFAWWPDPGVRAGVADVVVHSLAGASTMTVDQRIYAGQWRPIGIYELPAADVEIDMIAHSGAELAVDALRLQYLGAQKPPLGFDTDEELTIAPVGEPYSTVVEPYSGIAPYTFAAAPEQLPPGLALDPLTGSISGIPRTVGTYQFDVQLFDGGGQRSQRTFSIEVVLATSATPRTADKAFRLQSPLRAIAKDGVASGTPPDLSGLIGLIASIPEGEWVQAGLNAYSNVWTPADLRPLYGLSNPPPSKIILPWSSFAWDPNRGNLMLFGGGHANYPGNDVYLWSGATRVWQRASLPSQIMQDDLGNWEAVDGWDAAPASAHTYDNNMFFPHIDRMVVFGGAAFNSGAPWRREVTPTTSRLTGPFLFDPSKANANEVGGTTGSQVRRVAPYPDIVGGNMWANRDIYVNITNNPKFPGAQINGCTAYADENGNDVAYLGAEGPGGGTNLNLYRYTVSNLANPATDTIQQIGVFWNGTSGRTACGLDPVRGLFVRTGTNAIPFVYWNVATPGLSNKDVRVFPTDPTGQFGALLSANTINLQNCGFDFDPRRNDFTLWCGDGRVWVLTPPPSASPNGWTIVQQPTPTLATPNGDYGTGILGKWKYVSNLDAFIGLQDATLGNIWIYKPVGWVNPFGQQSAPPTPSNVLASDGTSSDGVTVTWNASSNATGYVVYRSTTPGVQGASVGTTNATTLFDASAVPGSIYYYGVVASGPGGTSALSAQDSGFAALPPPQAPKGVTASDGTSTTSVTITWMASSGAASYTVYRSASSGVQGSSIGTSTNTSYTDTTAVPGTVYYYAITATGPAGTSVPSLQDSGFARIPGSTAGSLAGSVAASSASVNLSTLGAIDWANWPPYDHKAAGGGLISDYGVIGTASAGTYYSDPRSFSWTDGTPNYSGNRNYGVQTAGVGNGLRLTVSADTTQRTVLVYVGGYNSGGTLVAHLSDASAGDFTDTSLSGAVRYDGVYMLTYQAGSSGQQLQITWSQASGAGNVSLQSAALFNGASPPPSVPAGVSASNGVSPGTVNVTWTPSTYTTTYAVYRSTRPGTQGGALATALSANYTDTAAAPGVFYYYSVTATGTGGTSPASAQAVGYVVPSPTAGGSIAASATYSTASVNLTALTATDWANWTPFDHKATGGGLISDYTPAGGGVVTSYFGDPRSFSWKDGSPYVTGNHNFGVQSTGAGTGFSFTVPADPATRTVTIYLGGNASGGKLTAHLSDGSAPDFVDTSLSGTARYDGVYTLSYFASTPNQQLLVTWTKASGTGSVSLQSVALQQ